MTIHVLASPTWTYAEKHFGENIGAEDPLVLSTWAQKHKSYGPIPDEALCIEGRFIAR